ncbi:hypothetical protein BGZ60DRAFT_437521 [Tricladium varicosporioides]|nr:hypothetical protein BGZ60DRAFT_437521 [Hymenoscyphus varicosporioides]
MLLQAFLFGGYVALVGASPLSIFRRQWTEGPKRNDLEVTKAQYKGIRWDEAYRDCNREEIDYIIEATRMALEVVSYKMSDTDSWWNSAAWHRYFVRSDSVTPGTGWTDHAGNHKVFVAMINTFTSLQRYPREGKIDNQGNNYNIKKQVTYLCNDPKNKCKKPDERGNWGGPQAYTIKPQFNKEEVFQINFCPKAWHDTNRKQVYINNLLGSGWQSFGGIRKMWTHEAMIIHEWMHASTISGFTTKVVDVRDKISVLPGAEDEQIYGDVKCHKYAWKYKVNGWNVINPKTADNADNWAWFFTYNYVGGKFGWRVDGSQNKRDFPNDDNANITVDKDHNSNNPMSLITRETEDDYSNDHDPDLHVEAKNLPKLADLPMPINCHANGNAPDGTPLYKCDYMGEDYDSYVAEWKASKESFKSAGNCDLSFECRNPSGNAINAKCLCTCDGKPMAIRDDKCAGFLGSLPTPPHA